MPQAHDKGSEDLYQALRAELSLLRKHVANLLDRPIVHVGLQVSASIPDATWTQVPFDAVATDTHGIRSASTQRITPTVAGWYQVNLALRFENTPTGALVAAAIRKNGVNHVNAAQYCAASGGSPSAVVSAVVYCDGATDYLDAAAWHNSGSAKTLRGTVGKEDTFLSMIRILDQPGYVA